jgi:tetratricopeptide (TPR) repeat protein
MKFQRITSSLFVLVIYLIILCPKLFPQNDYVPGMEQFPNINIIRYDLQAELKANTPAVKAKAIVEFQIIDKGYDYGVFEIDRRARIKSVRAKNGKYLKFNQPENADYVVVSLPWYLKARKETKIEFDYICHFPLLLSGVSLSETKAIPSQGNYFFMWKWYPVNDYYCDQAPADFTFTVPHDYEIITSGHEVETVVKGTKKTSQWRSYGASNYYFVFAGPFKRHTHRFGERRIDVYMDSDNSVAARAGAEKAEEILQFYEKLLGPYPYPTLNIVTAQAKMNPIGLEGLTYIDFEEFTQKYAYSDWTWSHELAHHWFGGAVRPKSPEDYCFVVEAPAEYLARAYLRTKTGEEQFQTDLEMQRMIALSGDEIVPITKFFTLESGGDFLYAKGFYVLHMLRHIMGDDLFFGMLKEFIKKFPLQPAGINDLKETAEEAYGSPLTWFFDQWVYGTGIPDYTLEYSINPTESGEFEIIAHIEQSSWKFRMPVEIVVYRDLSRDTYKFYVVHKETNYRFKVPFKPDGIVLDPEFKVLRWDDSIRVWIYAAKGRKLLADRQYDEGEIFLDKALKLNPKSTWAATEKANAAYFQGHYESAIQYFSLALEGDRDFRMIPWPHEQLIQMIYLRKGVSYDLLGKRQNAIRCYQNIIDMGSNPRFPSYYEKAERYVANAFFNKPSITLDSKILKDYVGQYELSRDFIITITQYNGHLYAENAGQQRVEIFAESSGVFFFKAVDAQITFVRNENGNVTGLILYDGRRETLARKIK